MKQITASPRKRLFLMAFPSSFPEHPAPVRDAGDAVIRDRGGPMFHPCHEILGIEGRNPAPLNAGLVSRRTPVDVADPDIVKDECRVMIAPEQGLPALPHHSSHPWITWQERSARKSRSTTDPAIPSSMIRCPFLKDRNCHYLALLPHTPWTNHKREPSLT